MSNLPIQVSLARRPEPACTGQRLRTVSRSPPVPCIQSKVSTYLGSSIMSPSRTRFVGAACGSKSSVRTVLFDYSAAISQAMPIPPTPSIGAQTEPTLNVPGTLPGSYCVRRAHGYTPSTKTCCSSVVISLQPQSNPDCSAPSKGSRHYYSTGRPGTPASMGHSYLPEAIPLHFATQKQGKFHQHLRPSPHPSWISTCSRVLFSSCCFGQTQYISLMWRRQHTTLRL
ncbi:hypothetical protein BJ166DRAFT_528618 [Pestalotiopsis sp. NC0098]|nr:hypothetical protein BJ166DRAFT_528618 [Pestalotiopsis sp. NC0098]